MENDNNKIIKIESKLENIKSICERNNEWLREDVENTKQLLKNHCERIRESEKNMVKVKTEIKPIVNLYNKFTQFIIGFCIILGTVIVSLVYFIKNKMGV